jgi:hypothetical protein
LEGAVLKGNQSGYAPYFLLVAKAIEDGAALKEIPLMCKIAETTVMAYRQ